MPGDEMTNRPAAEPADAGQPEESRHPDGRVEHPHVGFERSDASAGGVMIVAFIFCCVGSLTLYLVYRLYEHETQRLAGRRASAFPLAQHPSDILPPEPRLEQFNRLAGNESSNVYERQLKREKALASYGPTDEPGFVHIPIEVALRQLAGKLPVRQQPARPSEKDNGLVDSGEPNSGRLLRGPSP